MTKKDPIKSIIKRFNESYKDQELTERFKRFCDNDRIMVERYNKMIVQFDTLIENRSAIDHLIFSQLEGSSRVDDELIDRRKSSKKEINDLNSAISTLHSEIKDNQHLIDKYKVCNEKQQMLWWSILRDIGYFTSDWMEFKKTYGHHQF
jgi:hypothetical protein